VLGIVLRMGAEGVMLYYDFRSIPEEMFVPLYEYLCSNCGHRFEKIENHTASARKKCPKCGAKAERVLAPPAIQFKGSGWYVTDYAGKSSAGDAKKAETSSESAAPAAATKDAPKESTPKKKDGGKD
jgi:putative FmdB family regulatory protein